MRLSEQYLGKIVNLQIDRPLGSKHPKYGFIYELNYGYIPGSLSGDGEELDAYVLGIDYPVNNFRGKCIAVIQRTDDDDDKLIVIPENITVHDEVIEQKTAFQEKWFRHRLIRFYPTICLMCGFLGFGKTTYAKKLEQTLPAVRFTHDEFICKAYGRNPENFEEKYVEIDNFIRRQTEAAIKDGKNVILDYGFWTKKKRAEYYRWAKTLTPNVRFYAICCDIDTAKKRILERTKNNPKELFIDEECFNRLLTNYEPITEEEGYSLIFYNSHT